MRARSTTAPISSGALRASRLPSGKLIWAFATFTDSCETLLDFTGRGLSSTNLQLLAASQESTDVRRASRPRLWRVIAVGRSAQRDVAEKLAPQDARRAGRPDDPAVALGASGRDHPVMNRRTFLGGLMLGALAVPLFAETQQAGKIPRIGMLMPGTPWLIRKFLYCLRSLLF